MSTDVSTIDDRVPLRAPLLFMLIVLLGLGLSYSLAGTAMARLLFPQQAQGSLIEHGGRVVGSALVAQPFGDVRYFQPRPSFAGYDPMAAAGSNQARSNPDLRKRVDEAIAAVAVRERIAPAEVPTELVTQSSSGLDPHLSPGAVRVQIARVAEARGLGEVDVAALVEKYTEAPQFGLLGQPRVNVLKLNLALDARR